MSARTPRLGGPPPFPGRDPLPGTSAGRGRRGNNSAGGGGSGGRGPLRATWLHCPGRLQRRAGGWGEWSGWAASLEVLPRRSGRRDRAYDSRTHGERVLTVGGFFVRTRVLRRPKRARWPRARRSAGRALRGAPAADLLTFPRRCPFVLRLGS